MKPEKDIIKSIKNTNNSLALIEKSGELLLDNMLNAGLVRDIPILGTAISLFKAGNDLKAYLFTKKILYFLSEIETISIEERSDYFSTTSDKEEDKFGESLLLILDKVDDFLIAKMLGRAFVLLIKGTLVKQTYEIYIHTIKQLNPVMIKDLHGIYASESSMFFSSIGSASLANCGLVRIAILNRQNKNGRELETTTETTEFGKYFYDYIIK